MGGCHLVTTLDEAFAFVTRGLNLPFSDLVYLLPEVLRSRRIS
jgi:hypothetical protein